MANRYWVGGTGTWNTSSTTNWSASSGGASGASVPTAADSVFFDRTGTYTVTLTGALTCLDITVSAGTVTFSSTGTLAISGSMTLLAGTVWSATGTITFNSTSTGRNVTTNGVTISGAITFNGVGGGWTLGSAITTASNITFTAGTFSTSVSNYNITSSGATTITVNGGTLSLNGSTLTITTSTTAFTYSSGTVNSGTSQITVNNTSTSGSFNGGGQTYYNFTAAGAFFGMSISGVNTFNNFTLNALTSSATFTVNISSQTINGTLTLAPSTQANYRTALFGATFGTQTTLTVNAIAAGTANWDFRDIAFSGAGAPLSGTGLGDCGGNSNITFPAPKTVYWNLGGSTVEWGSNAWATTPTGTPSISNFPLAQDTATFTNSGAVPTLVRINTIWNIGTINMSGRTSAMTFQQANTVGSNIYGNFTLGTGVAYSNIYSIRLLGGRSSGSPQLITSNGVSFGSATFTVFGFTRFEDNTTVGPVTLTSGAINLNAKTVTTSSFSTSAGTKNLTFNGGTLLLNGAGTAFNNAQPTGFTTTAGTGTGTISLTSASAKTFVGGGSTYNCTLNQDGAGALTITGSNTFSNITNTYSATGATSILFTAGTTSTFTNWNASGASGNLLTIGSVTAASHTLSKSSGIVNANFLSISRSTATGGATWYAGANSTDGGNNTGWIFSSPSTGNLFLLFM